MSKSPDDLYSYYLDPYNERIVKREQASAEQQTLSIMGKDFHDEWTAVYRDKGRSGFAERCARRLIELANGIEERFWDFSIARLLLEDARAPEFVSFATAAVSLVYACRRDETAIIAGLSKASKLPNDIPMWHETIYDEFAARVRHPLTPPTTESELAVLLYGDVKFRTTINNQVRRGEWTTFGKRGSRRWSHLNQDRQKEVLQAFRKKFPEKPWLNVYLQPNTSAYSG